MEEPLTRSLLGGLRVVEVAGRYSGRFAASLLEALGASVTPVETVAALTAGLLAGTDVLITSGDNGEAGADPDPALRRRGGLDFAGVHVDVSPYGSTGACRAWKGDDASISTHAGLADYVGEPDREPLVPPVHIPSHQAGIAAAFGALAGLGGGPRRVEVAEFDVMATTHQVGLYPLAFFSGAIPHRAGRRKPAPYPFTHLPCADGWVCVAFIEGRQWKRFVEVMGSPEWASEERYRDRRMMGEQYPDEVDALIVPWLKTKTKAELLELALETRLPIVPLRTVEEVLESRQLAARNFWRTETIDGRAVRMPGLPFTFTPSGGASGGLSAPLTGRLVLDLGRVAAAPGVGQWLADLGATVIKVESRTHLDSSRKGRPLIASDIGASDAGATPNLMPFFISVNRGKRSLTLDLSTDAGRSVLDRLVARADVLIENFGAGGLEHLDLGPGRLHSIRPELVVIRVSAVGQTGPEAKLAGYAPHSTAAAGLDNLCRYPGGEPVGMIATNFGDMNTAAFGSLAALAGIRSGRGGTFDLSMLESNVTHLGPQLLEHQLGHPRPVPEPDGPAEPVPALGTEDLLFDDHIRARDLVVEIPHSVLGIVPVHGVPLRGGPGFMAVRGPAPDLGEHNGEILAELGLSAEEQRVLAAAGAFDGPV